MGSNTDCTSILAVTLDDIETTNHLTNREPTNEMLMFDGRCFV